MTPSEDEYLAWRNDPTTRFIFGVCRKTAHEVFNGWVQGAWMTGRCDEKELTQQRAKADAYLALEQCDYSDWIAKSDRPDSDIPLPEGRHPSPLYVEVDPVGPEDWGWLIRLFAALLLGLALGWLLFA